MVNEKIAWQNIAKRYQCVAKNLCRDEAGDGVRQIAHMADQPVRLQLGHRDVGIAEIDPDHRDVGAPGDPDVGAGIADHDRAGQPAAGTGHRLAQERRIRLGDPERVLAADGGKARRQVEPVEQIGRASCRERV